MKLAFIKQGFTLVELLIVIAILGILSVAVLGAINVTSSLNKANLSKAKTFAASVENALSINQVGKWSFDDSASPGKDTSGYGNDGTVNGATWQNANQCGLGFGGCLSFDGVDDYVKVQNDTYRLDWAISTTGFWYKHEVGSSGTVLAQNRTGDTYPGLWFTVSSDIVSMKILNGSPVVITIGSYQVSSGRWYYFTGTSQETPVVGDYRIRFYADGVLKGEQVQTAYYTHSDTYKAVFSIGSEFNHYGGGDVPHNFAKGMIDQVTVYNQSLTAYQIQQLYAKGLIRHQLAKK